MADLLRVELPPYYSRFFLHDFSLVSCVCYGCCLAALFYVPATRLFVPSYLIPFMAGPQQEVVYGSCGTFFTFQNTETRRSRVDRRPHGSEQIETSLCRGTERFVQRGNTDGESASEDGEGGHFGAVADGVYGAPGADERARGAA